MRAFWSAVTGFCACWGGQVLAYEWLGSGEPSIAACAFAAGVLAVVRLAFPGR